MTPLSALIAASADPVIEIGSEQLHQIRRVVDGATHQSKRPDRERGPCARNVLRQEWESGWVADQYVDQALLPQMPVPFEIHIPEDLARNISTERTVVATYSSGSAL